MMGGRKVGSHTKRCASETSKQWSRNFNGIRNHFTGMSGTNAALGWSVAQLDYNEDQEPSYAIDDTMMAEVEVRRTMKRVELWAILKALRRVDGLATDKLGVEQGLWKGGEGCVGPKKKDRNSRKHMWDILNDVVGFEVGLGCASCETAPH